jgi:hypothetical protein
MILRHAHPPIISETRPPSHQGFEDTDPDSHQSTHTTRIEVPFYPQLGRP